MLKRSGYLYTSIRTCFILRFTEQRANGCIYNTQIYNGREQKYSSKEKMVPQKKNYFILLVISTQSDLQKNIPIFSSIASDTVTNASSEKILNISSENSSYLRIVMEPTRKTWKILTDKLQLTDVKENEQNFRDRCTSFI